MDLIALSARLVGVGLLEVRVMAGSPLLMALPIGRFDLLARQITIATWRLRRPRLAGGASTDSIDIPTRAPCEASLGILEGIANMTRPNKLTRLTGMASLPILVSR